MYIQTASKSAYERLGEQGQAHMLGTYMFFLVLQPLSYSKFCILGLEPA